jgi:hypothetical protein
MMSGTKAGLAIRRAIVPLLLVALVGIAAMWFLVKPMRLLVPQWNGVHCAQSVCSDNPSRLAKATAIYDEVLDRLDVHGVSVAGRPTFVYCTTDRCYRSFGGGQERAISYPFLGTLIAPTSWQDYITRHELVHWIQFRELGAVTTMQKPEWFREGMAYVLSNAPVSDIPEHYLPMMAQYEVWSEGMTWAEIVREAKSL